MKAALFMIALLWISLGSKAQLGTNAFRFHHVIKRDRLYTEHNIDPCTNAPRQKKVFSTHNNQGNKKVRFEKHCNCKSKWYDLTYIYITEATCYDTIYDCCPNDTVLYLEKTISKKDTQHLSMVSNKLRCNLSLDPKIGIIVDFWPMSDSIAFRNSSNGNWSNRIANANEISGVTPINPSYFTIPLCKRKRIGAPNTYVKVGFRSWALGVGATNFRYRWKQGNTNGIVSGTVSSALSLNVNFGYALGYSKINAKRFTNYSVVFSGFTGLTSAELKSAVVENPEDWKTEQNRTNPAITYGANVVLSRNNFGIVFSLGFDSNIGPNAKQWIYQNKGWVGIGINTSLGIF